MSFSLFSTILIFSISICKSERFYLVTSNLCGHQIAISSTNSIQSCGNYAASNAAVGFQFFANNYSCVALDQIYGFCPLKYTLTIYNYIKGVNTSSSGCAGNVDILKTVIANGTEI